MKNKNVLIFPAGSEIGMEIYNSLKYSKFINLYGGTSANDHTDFVYKNVVQLPFISDELFIDKINQIIQEFNIDIIYPALDVVQRFLVKNKDKINAKIISVDYEILDIVCDKDKTYKFFNNYDFIPKTYNNISFDKISYPVFIKPKVGCGSIGAKIINNKHELEECFIENKDIVICEYLNGSEFTVDCLTDNNGKLLVCKARERKRIKSGISVRSEMIATDNKILEIANIINENLRFKGAWFFQLKKDNFGNYKLLEISARIPGTMGLSRQCGINFPLLTIYLFENEDINIIDNNFLGIVDRAFINCYDLKLEYENIYVDFDDTLILPNGKVNSYLMMFLYQCVNKNKNIFLISKHRGNLIEDLKKNKIDINLFQKIYLLEENENKLDYIDKNNSIFIDDSFAERKRISKLGIPVFDLDNIESLIDWRM